MPRGRRGKGDPKRVPDSRTAPRSDLQGILCSNSVNTGPMADAPHSDENNPMFAECQHPVVANFLVFFNGMSVKDVSLTQVRHCNPVPAQLPTASTVSGAISTRR